MNARYSVNPEKEKKSISVFIIGNNPYWDWVLYRSFHLYDAFNFVLTNRHTSQYNTIISWGIREQLLALFSLWVIWSPYSWVHNHIQDHIANYSMRIRSITMDNGIGIVFYKHKCKIREKRKEHAIVSHLSPFCRGWWWTKWKSLNYLQVSITVVCLPSRIIENFCAQHFILPKVLIVLSGRLFYNTGTLWNVEN